MKKDTLKRIIKYIGHYRIMFFASVLLAAASVTLTLYLPKLFGAAIDRIVGAGQVEFDPLIKLLITAAVVIAATALVNWVMNIANNRITYNVARDLRNSAVAKLHHLPFSYLDTHTEGETVSRIITDVDQFTDGLLMGFTQLFTGVMTIIGTLVFMLQINWKIALAVVVLTPLSLLLARFIASRTYKMFRLQSAIRGEQTGFTEEMVSNQKIVRAYGREAENMKRFDEINERLCKSSLSATFFSSLVNPTTRVINNIVYAVVAFAGAIAVISGSRGGAAALSVGGLSCMLAYATQYAKPFNEISGVVTELQNAAACAERLFELLDENEESPNSPAELESAEGQVELCNVSFSYTPNVPLIEDLSLSAKPGMRIAIVGPTGCGKTTLINLLMRFYDVCGGEILIDGTPINSVTRHSLRKNFGMVLQDTWIRRGTVRENIAVGRPDASDEEIIAAAKSAHAHSFIRRLPKGYDTVIGPDSGLSQGQRQLLCIARVMLTLPPMLILDEATSSIDTRTEMKIQDAFSKMMEGRTSFIVAHRLSTVRDADMILVMKDGHIIESGTHTSLLEKNGFYTHLYNSQFAK
mgnify:FL=1